MAERTFSIIKPDATRRNLTGAINAKLEEGGLRIVGQKRVQLTQEQAEGFYAVHKERPFYNDLVNFMISGPVVLQVLEGENAVLKNREIMGQQTLKMLMKAQSAKLLQNLSKQTLFMVLIAKKTQKLKSTFSSQPEEIVG